MTWLVNNSEFKVIVDERNSLGMAKGAIVRTFGICLSFNFDGVCFNYLLSTSGAEKMKLMYEIAVIYFKLFLRLLCICVSVKVTNLYRFCLNFVLYLTKVLNIFECSHTYNGCISLFTCARIPNAALYG